MFYVGQKVVCIGGESNPAYPYDESKIGEIYTISNIYETEEDAVLMLEFVELYMPATDEFEAGEPADLFRPIVERKTDISIFTAMLNPSDERVEA